MKRMIATGVVAFAATAAAIAATGDRLPGQWQATVTDMSGGKARVRTTMSCVAPGDTLQAELARQSGDGCRNTRTIVAGGRIDIAAVCPGGSATVTGSYTPTTLAFAWKGSTRIGGRTLPIDMRVNARRIAATCTEDE